MAMLYFVLPRAWALFERFRLEDSFIPRDDDVVQLVQATAERIDTTACAQGAHALCVCAPDGPAGLHLG